MTIEKGKDWGTVGTLAPGAPVVDSDAALAALFAPHGDGLRGPSQVGLTSGDLATTIGAHANEHDLRNSARTLLPLDLATVEVDGNQLVMAASLVVRSRLWVGPVRAVMNAAHLGDWNVAPRGHPNDGRLDVIEANLKMGDWLKARKRLPAGIHVPHPDISIRRLKSVTWEVTSGQRVWIDRVFIGPARSVTVRVHRDATVVAI